MVMVVLYELVTAAVLLSQGSRQKGGQAGRQGQPSCAAASRARQLIVNISPVPRHYQFSTAVMSAGPAHSTVSAPR